MRFTFAGVWPMMVDDEKDDVMMMVVIGVAMGQGVEIGAELVLSSR